MGNIDLTNLCVAFLTVLIGVFTYKAWPYMKAQYEQEFNEKQRAQIKQWVTIAVHAMEMIYKESGMGETKKQAVIEFVKRKLNESKEAMEKYGFTIDWEEINNLIEAAVKDMKE